MSLFGWYHLVFFGLVIPLSAVRSKTRVAGRPLPARSAHFLSTLVTLLLMGALSLIVARAEAIDLFPARWPRSAGVVAGVVMVVAAVGFMRPRWRRTVERRARIAYLFMPRTPAERRLWVLVAAAAALSEEITWRGVQPVLLTILIGRPVLSASLVAVTFGLGHMVQGWRSAAIIIIFAAAFQIVVWLSGTLYVAMAAHFIYDVIAGLSYGRLGEELGYPIESQEVSAAAGVA